MSRLLSSDLAWRLAELTLLLALATGVMLAAGLALLVAAALLFDAYFTDSVLRFAGDLVAAGALLAIAVGAASISCSILGCRLCRG